MGDTISKNDMMIDGIRVRRWFEAGRLTSIEVFNRLGDPVGKFRTERGALNKVDRMRVAFQR
jgi:hypothetical protein